MFARTADFELILGEPPIAGGHRAVRHLVQVFSPAGPASAVIDFDPSDKDLHNVISAASAAGPSTELRVDAGKELFDRLFVGEIAGLWHRSLGMIAGNAFDLLRVRLWFRDPAVSALPWELLYADNHFLATDRRLTISRYLSGPEPSFLDPVPVLRVLGVVSRPNKEFLEPIPDEAANGLCDLFVKLAPRVTFTRLDNPDLAAIQAKLAEGYHVLHYLGHGAANELIFTDKSGSPESVAVENLRQIVIGRRTLRAVVLNACESGQAKTTDVFAGVGPGLVRVGVPAVVAMQYDKVTLDTAVKFNETFYPQLASGQPIDVAVTEGRQAVSATDVADRGWSTPVLYVGTRGGRVVELAETPAAAGDDPLARLRQAVGEAADGRKALDQMAADFKQLLDQVTAVEALLTVSDRLQVLYGHLKPLYRFSGPEGRTLPPNGKAVIDAVWNVSKGEPLSALTAGVEAGPLDLAVAWLPVDGAVEEFRAVFDERAMNLIPTAIAGLGTALDDFAVAVRDSLARAVREASNSARGTLGRFS